jgi:hypothetical protein
MTNKEQQKELLCELKRYLEDFVRKYKGKTLHGIDIANHILTIRGFDKKYGKLIK